MSGELEGILVILCLNIIYAYGIFLPAASGQLNLGAAGFITLGAYCSAWVNSEEMGLGLPMLISIPGAILFTAAIAFVISFPILRTRGVYMVLATFAFAEVVSGLAINLEFIGAAAGMPSEGHVDPATLMTVAFFVVVFCYFLMSSRFGLAMRSVHDDEGVATLFGVDVRLSRVVAFTLGAALMGLGGALYGHHYNYVEAQTFNVLLSIFILLYVLIGGTQTVWGPLVGAAFFTFVPEAVRWIGRSIGGEFGKELIEYRLVVFGVIIVLMMVLRPEGFVTRTALERTGRLYGFLFGGLGRLFGSRSTAALVVGALLVVGGVIIEHALSPEQLGGAWIVSRVALAVGALGLTIGTLTSAPKVMLALGALWLVAGLVLVFVWPSSLPELSWLGSRIALGVGALAIAVGLFGVKAAQAPIRTTVAATGEGDVLKFTAVDKSFGGLNVINDVTFNVAAGSRTALIGPNGAGKTTVFNLMTGVYDVDQGSIVLDGEDITRIPARNRVIQGMSRSFQNIRLMPHLSTVENVMLGQHARARRLGAQLFPLSLLRQSQSQDEARAALAAAGLDEYPGQVVAELPYGIQKRIEVVRAQMANPKVLLLDEPAAGLNEEESGQLQDLLRQINSTGITLLVVEHDMHFVRNLCEHVVVLNFGRKIFEGTPEEVHRDPAVLEAYLGGDATVDGATPDAA